jgi:hypothetical protein
MKFIKPIPGFMHTETINESVSSDINDKLRALSTKISDATSKLGELKSKYSEETVQIKQEILNIQMVQTAQKIQLWRTEERLLAMKIKLEIWKVKDAEAKAYAKQAKANSK